MSKTLVEHFRELDDPRCAGKIEHRLINFVVIAVCAVVSGAESWEDMALYGRSKKCWLESFLTLPGELWRKLGDEGVRKAAYRGG